MATDNLPQLIPPNRAATLHDLFRHRSEQQPDHSAYRFYDATAKTWITWSWAKTRDEVARRQAALAKEGLTTGDKLAIMLNNGIEWVLFEQAALGLGLVVVPLYTNDRADNVAYILQDAGVKFLVIHGMEHVQQLAPIAAQLSGLVRVVAVMPCEKNMDISRLICLHDWLAPEIPALQTCDCQPDELATIVYTSGTTGRPKGVMLSHNNILTNAYAGIEAVTIHDTDVFLSFLPLSHMFERTLGYYTPIMAGALVVFARSIPQLAEDLLTAQPTVLISVPRIYERVYGRIMDQLDEKSALAKKLFHLAVSTGWARFEYLQGRGPWQARMLLWPVLHTLVGKKIAAKMGGRLHSAICGGAPISTPVAQTFVGLGINLIQGYGMTEASPMITANTPQRNIPDSIGMAISEVAIKISDGGELLCKGPNVMLGYWNNPEATHATIDSDGWLHTGDLATQRGEHYFITGRKKEIIVMSNGEKVPPTDMEGAIVLDPFIDQVAIVGEGRPYLTALLVLSEDKWPTLAQKLGLNADDPASLSNSALHQLIIQRIATHLKSFPGYAQIYRVLMTREPWTVENGLLTASLKQKRELIIKHYQTQVEALYAGH